MDKLNTNKTDWLLRKNVRQLVAEHHDRTHSVPVGEASLVALDLLDERELIATSMSEEDGLRFMDIYAQEQQALGEIMRQRLVTEQIKNTGYNRTIGGSELVMMIIMVIGFLAYMANNT